MFSSTILDICHFSVQIKCYYNRLLLSIFKYFFIILYTFFLKEQNITTLWIFTI